MRVFLVLCLLISSMASQAFAQGSSALLQSDIESTGKREIVLNNGRRYVLEHNLLVEYPELKQEKVNLKNVFDFDNSLVYHQELEGTKQLAVTPFAQLPPDRIKYVRSIGCFISGRSGSGNPIYADKEMYDFVMRNCKPAKR